MTVKEMTAIESVRQIVRAKLSDRTDADPRSVVNDVVAELDDAQSSAVLVFGIYEMTKDYVRHDRPSDQEVTDHVVQTSKPGRSRWSTARDRRESYKVGDRWMWLEECGVAELKQLVAQYEDLAKANQSKAERFRLLQKELTKSRCKTVGELLASRAK